jgi:cytoskeletal protein CcmA (bactofilin family)
MWKRDEAVRAPQPSTPAPTVTPVTPQEPAAPRHEPTRLQEKEQTVNIGKSVIIKGDLSGSEDLTIEGQVEGKIELRQNILTIGPNAKIKAQVFAKAVVVQGEVSGNITATERVDIRDAGSVDGDLAAPRIAIADGAHFRGSIDMQRAGEHRPAESKATEIRPAEIKPAAVPVAAAR